jgi:hypothetical protein
VCACALGDALAASAQQPSGSTTTTETDTTTTGGPSQADIQRLIDRYRHRVWHWQRVMDRQVTWTLSRPPAEPLQKVRVWQRIAERTQAAAQHPPHLRAWLCIHRFEGSWRDPNPPYFGGLQMDVGFQRTYGRALFAQKGTADHWTPLEQIWVAERALRAGRGFYPWPNTARFCGLI